MIPLPNAHQLTLNGCKTLHIFNFTTCNLSSSEQTKSNSLFCKTFNKLPQFLLLTAKTILQFFEKTFSSNTRGCNITLYHLLKHLPHWPTLLHLLLKNLSKTNLCSLPSLLSYPRLQKSQGQFKFCPDLTCTSFSDSSVSTSKTVTNTSSSNLHAIFTQQQRKNVFQNIHTTRYLKNMCTLGSLEFVQTAF